MGIRCCEIIHYLYKRAGGNAGLYIFGGARKKFLKKIAGLCSRPVPLFVSVFVSTLNFQVFGLLNNQLLY